MKRRMLAIVLMGLSTLAVQAGFGIHVGAYSPTDGLEDNDNSILLGANLHFKFATFGIKAEAFYVDSSGRYENVLGENFGNSTVDLEALLGVDFLFYPLGTTFFLQAGVNHVTLDAEGLDLEVIDNEIGLSLGAGFSVLDKLMIQGKVLYTPDAIEDGAVSTLRNLDNNLLGFMVTAGWQF